MKINTSKFVEHNYSSDDREIYSTTTLDMRKSLKLVIEVLTSRTQTEETKLQMSRRQEIIPEISRNENKNTM